MNIEVELEYCYGINRLSYKFDFSSQNKTFSIYSSNGMMKTSFAKTFEDFSKGEESKDLMFPERETKRIIKKDGEKLQQRTVFVIQPYIEKFFSDKVSTLLVNQDLRDKYKKIHSNIDEATNNLLEELKNPSGLKTTEIPKEASKIFMQNQDDKFIEALESIKARMKDDEGDFKDIKYNAIFNDRALAFLNDSDNQKNIEQYMKQYDELIDRSIYFKKGIFNHSQAEDVAKQLEKNGFFKAEHSVFLRGHTDKISTQAELKEIIEKEKSNILENEGLKKIFNALDSKLKTHKDLRDFREYLLNHTYVLAQLSNVDSFKAKLWLSYLKQEHVKTLYENLLQTYSEAKKEISKIVTQAKEEETQWLRVVEIFNERFFVPFKVTVDNQVEVILNNQIPIIAFEFQEQDSSTKVDEDKLLSVLSQGEKRALYILNIIFEVEARKHAGQETLFIIDDIADSFDYKNKYAIIEYLKDISEEEHFYQIVLTHNFDFHRTISSRLNMQRSNILNTLKTSNSIELREETYQNNPFNNWKGELGNPRKLIASIPFVRNLAEFSSDDDTYQKITSFLHIKDETLSLKAEDLKNLFDEILKCGTNNIENTDKNFLSLLEETSSDIIQEENDNMELESKITLAIAIRLKTEQFIIQQTDNNSIDQNQTYELVKRYKEKHSNQTGTIKILEKVLLMTPENIHVNSFMYEPIIDMSGEHLKQLYGEVVEIHPL